MGSIKGWYYGWRATIRIHLFERDTLRQLKQPMELGDFGEVPRPGSDDEHREWLDSLKEGDLVCDCRFRHLKIISRDGDDVMLSDGSSCSLRHCCEPADHPEPHPGDAEIAKAISADPGMIESRDKAANARAEGRTIPLGKIQGFGELDFEHGARPPRYGSDEID